MLIQPQGYFHWLLTDISCVCHIANVTRRDLTQPTLPLQSMQDPKQTSGAPTIAAQGTKHPTNKYWIANLWQVENKSASPEVEEKAEFKAATELVAKCQYHSLQGSIKRSIWQAGPPGWENKAVEHSPPSPAAAVLCPAERHPPHLMCHSRGGTIVISPCKTGMQTAGCKTLPIRRAVADALLHPTDAPLHPTDAKSPFPCSSWGLLGWFYHFTSEIPSTFGCSHSTTRFCIWC